MQQPVVMKQHSTAPRRRSSVDVNAGWRILAGLGIAIALVGWTDVVLGWFPLQFGNPEWEFGTISATFDGMPLATIGLALIVLGLVVRGGRLPLRIAAIGLWFVAACLAGTFAVYVLDLPLAWRGLDEPLRPTLLRAIARTSIFAVVYLAFFSWLGWFAWKRSTISGKVHQ